MKNSWGWVLGLLGLSLIVDLPIDLGRLTIYHTELALAVVLVVALPVLWNRKRSELLQAATVVSPLLLWLFLHGLKPGPLWDGVKAMLRAGELLGGLWLPVLLLKDEADLQVATKWVLLGLGVTCVWALAQTLAGPGSSLNAGREIEIIRGFQAASAGFGHHNQLGAFLVAALALCAALLFAGELKRWAWAGLALSMAALVCSYSRGAWVGSLVVMAVLVVLLKPRQRYWIFGLGIAFLALAWIFSPALQGRLMGLFSDPDREIHRRALKTLEVGHGWWGWGTEQLQTQLKAVAAGLPLSEEARHSFSSHAHNFYLQQVLAFGWPVLVLWAAALAGLIQLGWRLTRVSGSRSFALAFLGALIAFALQSYTDLLTLHARGLAISMIWGLLLAWGLRNTSERKN